MIHFDIQTETFITELSEKIMSEDAVGSIMIIGSDLHFCYLLKRYVRKSAHPLLFSAPDGQALEVAARA